MQPQVIEGDAIFTTETHHLNIQAQDKTIIHWEEFSINSGEKTQFQLPSSEASVLNRVTGMSPSEIQGCLQSNGKVFLLNPNGILIGKEGIVQTGSFYASTLDLADSDFLEGKELLFTDSSSQAISNKGTIIADSGDVFLLARQVINEGEVRAQGEIGIGVGKEILLRPSADEKIHIRLHPRQRTEDDPVGIQQTGKLEGARVELKADGNLYSYAIKNEGLIEAIHLEKQEGRIFLVAEEGVACHSGTLKAHEVRVLGEHVQLIGQAVIDASSPNGGGEVLLGGDYQGSNPEILNALSTIVEEGVVIYADALEKGNGGKVIMWAEGVTGCYGKVNVRGGPEGGDGGFVEASGKLNLGFSGLVDATAPLGKTGMLLLDPTNITISTAATSNLTPTVCPGPYTTITTPGVAANVNNTQLATNLATCSVTINTSATAGGAQAGTIVVSAASPVSWVSNNSLTFIANSSITIGSDITNTSNAASMTFTAGTTAAAVITVSAGVTVSLTGSGVSPTGTLTFNANTTANGDITIAGTVSATDKALTFILNDDFTLNASPATITFNSPGKIFTLNATGAGSLITLNGPVTVTNGSLDWDCAGTVITAAGVVQLNSSLSIAGTGTVAIDAVGTIATGASSSITHTSTGNFSMTTTLAGSDININGTLSVTGANLSLTTVDDFTLAASPASITFNSPGQTFVLATTLAAGSVVTLTGPVIITSGIVNWDTGPLNINGGFSTLGTGTVNIDAAGAISMGAASPISLGSTGNVIMTTTAADITVNGTFTATSSNVTFTPFDDFILAATGTMAYSAAGKTLTFSSGPSSTFTFTGPLSVTAGNLLMTAFDDITISATTGSITYNVVGGSCSFLSSGGVDPDLNINGTLTITNGTFTATTFDDIIVGALGTFNYNSPDTASISATGTDGDIVINGILSITNGTMTMSGTDDITFAAGSTTTHSSAGSWTLNTTGGVVTSSIVVNGTMNITNGTITWNADGAITFGGAGETVTYTSPLPWTMTADLGSITFGKTVNLNTAADWTMTAPVGSIAVNNLVRNTSTGDFIATAGGDFTVGTVADTFPAQFGTASGMTQIVAGGDLIIHSSETTPGATAILGFSSGGSMGAISVTAGGNGLIISEESQNAGIDSSGTLTLTVGGDLSLTVDNFTTATGSSFIESASTMMINAGNITMTGFNGGPLVRIEATGGDMTVISQRNLTMIDNAFIRNLGSGKLFVVVDQQAPLPPQVGNGQLNLYGNSAITASILGIFTATPDQNTFQGFLNGQVFTAGEQVFGVWYSLFTGTPSLPFTIYYKGEGVIRFADLAVALTEMTQQYLDRRMGWAWISSFFSCRKEKNRKEHFVRLRKPFEYPLHLAPQKLPCD